MSEPVTFEQAKICWQCGHSGKEHINQKAANGDGRVYTIICMNKVCPNFDSGWVVQVKQDGTIPVRDKGNRNKQFQVYSDAQKSAMERQLEEARRLTQESTEG